MGASYRKDIYSARGNGHVVRIPGCIVCDGYLRELMHARVTERDKVQDVPSGVQNASAALYRNIGVP